jgi:hypothetical protein
MKRINNLSLPKDLAAFVHLTGLLSASVTQRTTVLTNMSGYPIANHVVGRIQRRIKLDSSKALLESILDLRNLTRLASDILNTMLIAKLDRNQMVRTEVVAYVSANAENYGMRDLSELDKEFVAYLITSSESHEASWMLDSPESASDNLVCKLSDLYRTLLNNPGSEFTDKSINSGLGGNDFAVYSPGTGKIISITDTPAAKNIIDTYKTSIKGVKDDNIKATHQLQAGDHLAYLYSVNAIANLRVIDHIGALLTNVDIWKRFISPRKTNDASQNKERADSLKLLASYFHSLLMYPHLFSVELFKGTYDRIQNWLVPFPALPAHIIAQYDDIIKKHDVLGASVDVNIVLSAITIDKDTNIDSSIYGFLREFTIPFNISDTMRKIDDKLTSALTPINFESLKNLSDPKYTYLLMSHPIDEFDMATDVTTAVVTNNAVIARIVEATSGIIPGIARFYSSEVLTSLNGLNLRISYPIVTKASFTDNITGSTSAILAGGTIKLKPLTPLGSYDYQFHIRRNLMYSVFKAHDVIENDKFLPTHITNLDLAKKLRTILGHNWSSLMPSSLAYGDNYFSHKMLKSDPEAVRRLLETLSGMQYDLIVRTIGNQFIREMWATFMSSFGLLYVLPDTSDINALTKQQGAGALAAFLVTGYGRPYGSNYTELAARQPAIEEDELIMIAPTVYMRMLKVVPLPSERMNVDPNFYTQHPYYYYPANSKVLEVSKWVVTEGLLHMAMSPIHGRQIKPLGLFDTRYAYANDSLMIQMDLNYTLKRDTDTSSDFTAPIQVHEWPYDRYKTWIDYGRLTVYGSVSESAADIVTNDNPVTELLNIIEEKQEHVEKETTVSRIEDTKTTTVSSSDVTSPSIEDKGDKTHKKPKPSNEKKNQKNDDKKEDSDDKEDEEEESKK